MAKKQTYDCPANLVLSEVLRERYRQDEKWGVQDHGPMVWLGILAEEFGEVAKEANDFHFLCTNLAQMSSPSAPARLAELGRNYREELVQVAAVAVAMIESYDRNEGKRK